MALWSHDQGLNVSDERADRIAAGTVAGDHVVPSTLGGKQISQVIKPFDPRVQYFGGPSGGTWQLALGASALYRFSTYASCNTPGAQITVTFTGTAIAVFGPVYSSGGMFDAYIDNNLYNGITITQTYIPALIPAGQQVPPSNLQIVPLNSTTTTITAFDTSSFPASGILRIDTEQITYSSLGLDTLGNPAFLGCVRGANGTIAATHQEGSQIYLLRSGIDTYSASASFRQKLWSADDLPPGQHTLTLQIRTDKNPSSTDTRLNVDSFTIGGILGGTAVNLRTQQISFGTVSTNGSGLASGGTFSNYISGEQLVGILGLHDDSHKLGYQIDLGGNLWFYGAATTAYTNVTLTVMYLGTTI